MSGRRIPFWAIVIVAGVVAYQWLARVPEQSAGSSGPATADRAGAPPRPVGPASAYALRTENSWPPLADADPAGSTADADLLAANYYVVLDGSGSMTGVACSAGQTKIEAARTALASFAQSLPPGANLGLAVFERRGPVELLPLGAGNRDQFVQAVQQVAANGGTPLSLAVGLAYDRLLEQGRGQLGYGEYHLVVVTDGIASPGYDPTAKVDQILAESPVVVHTIGFCIGEQHSLNQPGRTSYRAADNPDALRRGLDAVLAEAPSFAIDTFGAPRDP